MPGQQVAENPEVIGLLITTGYERLAAGVLLAREPREIRWFHQGRLATRSEVQHAIEIAGERDEAQRHPNRDEIIRKLRMLWLPAS